MANPIVLPDDKPYPGIRTAAAPDLATDPYDLNGVTSSWSDPVKGFAAPINNTQPSGKVDFSNTQTAQAQNIPMPIGGQTTQRNPYAMQSTAADRPANYPSPTEQMGRGYAAAGLAGLGAGGTVAPTTDSTDALMQVGGSTLGGAAQGALYGSIAGGPGAVVGGAVGGLIGLVSGGLNAFVGTRSAREAKRQQEKINQAILARQDARYQQERADQEKYFNINRSDTLEQTRYNRKQDALASTWKAQEAARQALNDTISTDANFKKLLFSQVR